MPTSLRFGASRTRLHPGDAGIELAVPLLAGTADERLWPGTLERVDGDLLTGSEGPWRCVALSVPVTQDMRETTRSAYARLLAALGPAHSLRIWNYVPAINEEAEGLENYRAFCAGRHEAFAAFAGAGFERHFCAASAVGTVEPRLSVIALATEFSVEHLENPFQCPAYHYPPEYGPRSPSFSRASVVAGSEPVFYISGTSAVLGAASVAPGDLPGQLASTGENLLRMLAQGRRVLGAETLAGLEAPFCRVYLRRPEDVPVVQAWLEKQPWFDAGQYMIVQADICRRELLVEIELSWAAHVLNPSADTMPA
ncbi:hypothetical protein H5P28_08900 [Ruficoccus amylovorans]|uniref:Chorismatase FkbO/Hyg5-like N-terminal domain-containing protein n=1 Tax=Ruficoccus amylovorans TaxID=1804625 RepID=A0A842HD09_9BACT|nr:hypothetical protein [Ruficoccus amylovorans]MBC2594373.1 hypothetical protein [Ruficoccus amylovorans]